MLTQTLDLGQAPHGSEAARINERVEKKVKESSKTNKLGSMLFVCRGGSAV